MAKSALRAATRAVETVETGTTAHTARPAFRTRDEPLASKRQPTALVYFAVCAVKPAIIFTAQLPSTRSYRAALIPWPNKIAIVKSV